jgi:hypothetical protein
MLPNIHRTDRDQQSSIGAQDAIVISARLRTTTGFSADPPAALKAQDVNTKANTFATFTCPDGCAAAPFTSCLDHVWDFNPLASFCCSVANSGPVFATFAVKDHSPTFKERRSRTSGLGPSILQIGALAARMLSRIDVRDAIENANVPAQFPGQCHSLAEDPTLGQPSINVREDVHQGVGFAIRSTPMSRLNPDANDSFLDQMISSPPNMPPIFPTGTSNHRVRGTASIQMPRKIILIATARYESGMITLSDSNIVASASNFRQRISAALSRSMLGSHGRPVLKPFRPVLRHPGRLSGSRPQAGTPAFSTASDL